MGQRLYEGWKDLFVRLRHLRRLIVLTRVSGNLWVFGMVALEKTCFKGQMPSENRFQTAFLVCMKQLGKPRYGILSLEMGKGSIFMLLFIRKGIRTLRLHGSRTR